MTDPETADRTYIEPITWEIVAKIIEKERPDALLPTLGGQTALNTAMDLHKHGVLEKFGVEMIGADADVIDKAEDRAEVQGGDAQDRPGRARKRRRPIAGRGPGDPRSGRLALRAAAQLHHGRHRRRHRLQPRGIQRLIARGLDLSPVDEVLIEESVIGWKEYELEVMRDQADNVVIVCSIENFDPMGVHTGD